MAEACLFCEMAQGKRPVEALYEDDMVFSLRDIHPRAPVHFMVIPREHIPTAADLADAHGSLLARMFQVANRIAQQEGIAERGYRLAVNCREHAGQTIYHLHLHVLGGRPLGPEG